MNVFAVFGLTVGADNVVEVQEGDVLSVYVDGDATLSWRRDQGTRCAFAKIFAANDVTALTRFTVPRGINQLLIQSQAGPAQATVATVATERTACGV